MSYGDSIGNNNIAVSASMYQHLFTSQTGYNTAFGTANRNAYLINLVYYYFRKY